MDGDTEGDRLHVTDEMRRILVKIGLCQNDHRRQAAVVDQSQVTLDAAQVKIPVQSANDKYSIKICGNDLFLVMINPLPAVGPPVGND